MKKSISIVAATVLIGAGLVFSCQTPSEKVENAQANVVQANSNLDKANDEYLSEIEAYRKISADKIATNDKSMIEYRARIDKQKKEAREEYKARIDDLEKQNGDLKKKMEDYKAEGKDNWEVFKSNYNRDMDSIGRKLDDLNNQK